MAKNSHEFTTPPGRLVTGSVYQPRTKDNLGGPLTIKTGPNAGQPRVDYNFGVAIPKTPGCTHWSSESVGRGSLGLRSLRGATGRAAQGLFLEDHGRRQHRAEPE